ncbi:MAG: hypothetical protein AAGA80_17980 [Cyanobacteria bacterium P01_F01_bin.143]
MLRELITNSTFEKIIGQNRAITLLEQAIALDRIAPTYLFVDASIQNAEIRN